MWSLAFGAALLVFLLTSLSALAESRGPLKTAIDPVLDRAAFSSSLWGIDVRRQEDGALLYATNATTSVVPASVLKLVSTATALDVLGADASFPTTIETTASLDAGGRLRGDLYLVGHGDPTLVGRDENNPVSTFDRLAEAVSLAGVREIEGRILGHDAAFSGERRAVDWAWSDLMWYYGAEVSGLCFNNGAAHLRVRPGPRVGSPVVVERNPESRYYEVRVEATTTGRRTRPDLRVERPLGSNVITLGGNYPLRLRPESLFVALENPALYATTVFAEILAERGVHVRDDVAVEPRLPAGTRVIAGLSSPPLAELLKLVNHPSHNLRAEMLLRLAARKESGEGTYEAGLDAMERFLERIDVPTQGFSLRDGCGLAPTNLVTAEGIVKLLRAMDRHPQGAVFRASLPLAGREGTLRNRFRRSPVAGRMRAKTGFIRHTYGLAGYMTTKRGENVVFAIFLNHHTRGSGSAYVAIEDICERIAEY